ncbi:hypothetical protein [Caballeronia arationis]|uniref:hypothetical protein n=1 Tax=Caballeronia arationis TaxID=1777142 RepID=UPI00117DBE9C|nr:hypothetical protein [Caballeronia arationis]
MEAIITPDSIAALLINLQVDEALILPIETTLQQVECAMKTARTHTTLKRYVLGQHLCSQAGLQYHRVLCCSVKAANAQPADDSGDESSSDEKASAPAERDAA